MNYDITPYCVNTIISKGLKLMPRQPLSPIPKPRLLFDAASIGNNALVAFLLDHGANIHGQNDLALRWAAENGHTETVKLLLDRGANIHACDDAALRYAAAGGHTEMVKLLLDRGANIHAYNDDALSRAANKGHTETVKLLKARMATCASPDQEIATRLEALTKSFNELAAFVRSRLGSEPAPKGPSAPPPKL